MLSNLPNSTILLPVPVKSRRGVKGSIKRAILNKDCH